MYGAELRRKSHKHPTLPPKEKNLRPPKTRTTTTPSQTDAKTNTEKKKTHHHQALIRPKHPQSPPPPRTPLSRNQSPGTTNSTQKTHRRARSVSIRRNSARGTGSGGRGVEATKRILAAREGGRERVLTSLTRPRTTRDSEN